MLVLSRKENETIEFPEIGIQIRLFGLTRKRVQVGIDAPISLTVQRGEKVDGVASAGASGKSESQSIAEYVIGQEFQRLESELSAIAELAATKDQPMARSVAGEAIGRIERLRRTIKASLRGNQRNGARAQQPVDEAVSLPESDAVCVRQTPASYAVCVA